MQLLANFPNFELIIIHHFSTSVEVIDFTKLPQTSLSPIALPRSLKSIPLSLDITSGYVNLQLFRLPVEFGFHRTKLDAISLEARKQWPANCTRLLFSLRDFVHSGYCDPQRRLLLLLLLALALALASSQIVSPPKIWEPSQVLTYFFF